MNRVNAFILITMFTGSFNIPSIGCKLMSGDYASMTKRTINGIEIYLK